MAEVWILTKGSYSDYTILAVFSSEDVAHETGRRLACGAEPERGEDQVDYGDYHVERHELDAVAWKARYKAYASVEDGRLRWAADVRPLTEQEGDGDYANTGTEVSWSMATDYSQPIVVGTHGGRRYPKVPSAFVAVYADEVERALKVASERAAQLIADWPVEVEAARSRGELA